MPACQETKGQHVMASEAAERTGPPVSIRLCLPQAFNNCHRRAARLLLELSWARPLCCMRAAQRTHLQFKPASVQLVRKKSSKRTENELCVPTLRPHSSYTLLLHLYISTTPVTTRLQSQMQLYFTCFHHKAYILQPVLQLRSHINFPFFYLHLKTPPAGPAAHIWPDCSGAQS